MQRKLIIIARRCSEGRRSPILQPVCQLQNGHGTADTPYLILSDQCLGWQKKSVSIFR
jgi:hypothetical protein